MAKILKFGWSEGTTPYSRLAFGWRCPYSSSCFCFSTKPSLPKAPRISALSSSSMISPLDPLIPSSSTLSTPVGSTFSPPMTKFSLLRYGYFIYDGAVIFSPSVQRKFLVSGVLWTRPHC